MEERHIVIRVGPEISDIEVNIEPVRMTYDHEDETVSHFEIERVKDIKRIVSQAGGIGDRYTVKILGRERYIWRERGTEAWFVEKKIHQDRAGSYP